MPQQVRITTNHGDIIAEIDTERAPITGENFLRYADEGFFDGTIFHRVIDGFMIQGGGFTSDMKQKKSRGGIKNEWQNGLKNTKGTLAMARVGGQPDSGSSQFFINVVDNAFLDRKQDDGAAYAVFGRVVEGMDVVDAIRRVRTTTRAGHADVPAEAVVIERVTRVE